MNRHSSIVGVIEAGRGDESGNNPKEHFLNYENALSRPVISLIGSEQLSEHSNTSSAEEHNTESKNLLPDQLTHLRSFFRKPPSDFSRFAVYAAEFTVPVITAFPSSMSSF